MSQYQNPTQTSTLPIHSPLGASGAKRFMECAGSVTLIRMLMEGQHFEYEEEDWTAQGIQAHELAAHCLNASIDTWQADPAEWPELDFDMMAGVQVYLNHVRSIRGYNQRWVEYKLHRSEFHPWCYGTVDCAVQDRKCGLHVIDYKHGVGVVVEVENNSQLMYYAFMVIDELDDMADEEPVTLTIVQPRVTWYNGGKPRSWDTTVGYIKTWAMEVLRPAMEQTGMQGFLSPGEHCRFCPAKMICPAFLGTAKRLFSLTEADIKGFTEAQLGELLAMVPVGMMAIKALKTEARHRTINSAKVIPGWKLVQAMADRMWKDGAPVADRFGYQPQKIKSPAQVEEEVGGKAFVAEWAFAPNAGYDLVPESDRRKPVNIQPGSEVFKKALDTLGKRE